MPGFGNAFEGEDLDRLFSLGSMGGMNSMQPLDHASFIKQEEFLQQHMAGVYAGSGHGMDAGPSHSAGHQPRDSTTGGLSTSMQYGLNLGDTEAMRYHNAAQHLLAGPAGRRMLHHSDSDSFNKQIGRILHHSESDSFKRLLEPLSSPTGTNDPPNLEKTLEGFMQ